ncbi:hypothetical protein ACGFYY_25000 [Streptomyces sp. NPDC048331]|uniref:hypothetical protein n=1 Tax=Streptomyces sp. NPDC048331 TaxID=3365534 RepID=UPI00371FAE56
MTTWFRTYYEDEDLWLYFEADDEGWAARQVEVRRQDSRPVTAASLEEVLHLRDHADVGAMFRTMNGSSGSLPKVRWKAGRTSLRRTRSLRRSSRGCGLRPARLSAIQADLAG